MDNRDHVLISWPSRDIVKSNKLNLNNRLSASEVINKVYDESN